MKSVEETAPRGLTAWMFMGCAALIAAGAIVPLACSKDRGDPAAPQGAKPVPVLAAFVTKQSVPVEIRTFGTVQANSTVTVKAQVTGILNKVHFRKGQEVKKDQLLFEIDPRSFEASLKQLAANKARDQAALENAHKELNRQAELLQKGVAAQADFDKAKSDADSFEAAVKADEASIDNAKLLVGYCTIRSPIDGRAGDRLTDEGNLVQANSTSLVTITQVQPIMVYFGIPQRDLPDVRKYMAEGKLRVAATIKGTDVPPEEGELTFVDNTMAVDTRVIQVAATFPNQENRLWPGSYVDVLLTLTVQKDAITVPTQAVQTGREGTYVFVIVENGKKGKVAEVRPVAVERSTDGITIIKSGLVDGDQIVTDGQVRLLPGAKIEIKENPAKGGATSSPAASGPARPGKAAGATTSTSGASSQRS